MKLERKVSRAIAHYCAQNNICQKHLGASMGVPQQTINSWATERCSISRANLVLLEQAIGPIGEMDKKRIAAPYYICFDKEANSIELCMQRPPATRADILLKYENEEEMLRLAPEDYCFIFMMYQAMNYEKYWSAVGPFLKWRKKERKAFAREWCDSEGCEFPSFFSEITSQTRDYYLLRTKIANRIYQLTSKATYDDVEYYQGQGADCIGLERFE